MEKYAKAQMEVIEFEAGGCHHGQRHMHHREASRTALVLAQTIQDIPVKVFDLLQQAGRCSAALPAPRYFHCPAKGNDIVFFQNGSEDLTL